jgi:hypothetical protein
MTGRLIRLTLLAAAAISTTNGIRAADFTPYFDSAASDTPRSNAGLSLAADRLTMKADLAVRAPDRETQIVPNVSSAFELAHGLNLETRLNLADWNSADEPAGAKFDTRVHFQSSAPFLDEFEGRYWHSPEGQTGRLLKFGFYQKLRESSSLAPLTIRSRATLETLHGAAAVSAVAATAPAPNQRVGWETELGGFTAGLLPGRSALKLRVERVGGAQAETTRSLAYDQTWSMRNLGQFGVNVKMLRATLTTADALQPSIGISWRAQF